MIDLYLGWVAGIVEGEGWIGIRRFTSPEVQVMMTDSDIIDRLLEWTGVGNVSGNQQAGVSVGSHQARRRRGSALADSSAYGRAARREDSRSAGSIRCGPADPGYLSDVWLWPRIIGRQSAPGRWSSALFEVRGAPAAGAQGQAKI